MTYVLIGAFEDDGYIYPVKFTIMKMDRTANDRLYVAMTMPGIEKTRIDTAPDSKEPITIPLASFDISLYDLLREVKSNPMANSLGQYIPEQFLEPKKDDVNTKHSRKGVNIDYVAITEAADQNREIEAVMDVASDWRKDITTLDSRGLNDRSRKIIDMFGDNLDEKKTERITHRINNLAKEIVSS